MKYKFSGKKGFIWCMRGLILHILLSISVFSFANVFLSAGQGILQRKITLRVENLDIKSVLKIIESSDSVRFAYQSQAVNMNRQVSLEVENAPLLNVLSLLFDSNYEFDEFGHFIVIKSKRIDVGFLVIVNGTVRDEKTGEVLPGVNVVIRGTTQGTTTDADGKYSLPVDKGAVLVFTFVGYKTQEVSIAGRTTVDIKLESEAKTLDELVVIGYGEQSRKMLTTSITKVSADDIGTQVVSNPADALSGLSSGVQVQAARGGYPGASPAIRIRGTGTIGGSADVLYVVDGYPLQDADNFKQISPNDIESMEILKDAASAAIYGSRAANGVVIVTTKTGKAGKTAFDVSYYQGYQSMAKTYDMMNAAEYVATVNKATEINSILQNKNLSPPSGINNPGLPDTDWQKLVYRKATIRDFNISASGGSQKIKFMVSGGGFKQDGVMRGSSYERYTLRLNVNAELTPRLHIGVNMAPSYSDQFRMPVAGSFNVSMDDGLGASLPNLMLTTFLSLPIVASRLPNGDYGYLNNAGFGGLTSPIFSPLAIIENVKNRFQNYSFLGKTFLEYDLLENLTAKSTLAISYTQINQNGFIPPHVATNNASFANFSKPALNNIWSVERSTFALDWLWENTLNCKFDLGSEGQHHFNALAFGSIQKNNFRQVSTNGKPGSYFNSIIDNPSASTDLLGGVAYTLNAFVSMGGRLTYDYKNKYLLAVAIRRDGSSKFGPHNRYASFPSVSVAWRAIEERFLDGVKEKLSDLKFRVSYGQTGNANIGSFNWANGIVSRNYVFGGIRNLGAGLSGYANYDLTWEKNEQFNYGLDAGFFNDKVTLGVDYYTRITHDMLLNRELPGIYGYARTARTNTGKIKNTGIEWSVGTISKGKVGWVANYNFSINYNEVMDLGGPTSLPAQSQIYSWPNTHQVRVGEPLGNINGFVIEGLFRRPEDLLNYPQWQGNGNVVGDWRIKDTNGDRKITEEDRTRLGNGIPKYYFGTTQRLSYKAFDLTVMMQGVAGVEVLNGNLRYMYNSLGTFLFNMPKDAVDNYYDPRNPDADVQLPAPYRAASGSQVTINNQVTNFAVQEASFLRVKNVTLGYHFPNEIVERLRIKRLRVYLTGQNVFTFTGYRGLNPEVSIASGESAGNTDSLGSGSSAALAGIDQGAYPAVQVFTCGVNFSF